MAAQVMFPDPRFRSPTASPDDSDARDENVFSAVVMQHSGAGQTTIFGVPKGQTIPTLGGSSAVPTAGHQTKYSELTTNITQSGQMGSALGDGSVRGIGITVENAYVTAASGAANTYGATQQEVCEILAKTFFQLKVGGKLMIQGPSFLFPAAGSVNGSVSTTGNAATVSFLNNGWPGSLRRLRLPILIARTDNVEGVVGVGGSSSFTFSVTTGVGQPTLVWYTLEPARRLAA